MENNNNDGNNNSNNSGNSNDSSYNSNFNDSTNLQESSPSGYGNNTESSNNNSNQQNHYSYTQEPQYTGGASGFNPYPANGGFTPYQDAPVRLKQSGPGIASFIISLAALLLIIVGFISMGVFIAELASNEALLFELDASLSNNDVAAEAVMPIIIMVICIFGSMGLAVVGLILGIIGVVMKNRRKGFAITGLIMNGLFVVGAIGLFVIGLLANTAA